MTLNMRQPPQSLGRHFHPVPPGEVRLWLARYNEWVELWNFCERDRDYPLSPEWEGETTFWPRMSDRVLVFISRGEGKLYAIRFRDWKMFEDGWSCCRNPATESQVAWAAWRPASFNAPSPPSRFDKEDRRLWDKARAILGMKKAGADEAPA